MVKKKPAHQNKKCQVEHRLHENVLNSNRFCFGQTLVRGTEVEIHITSMVVKKMIHIVMLTEASRRTCLPICKKPKTTTL